MDPVVKSIHEFIVAQKKREGYSVELENGRATFVLDDSDLVERKVTVVVWQEAFARVGTLHRAVFWIGVEVKKDTPPDFGDVGLGFGETREEAALNATDLWLIGTLPSILAFLSQKPQPRCTIVGSDHALHIAPYRIYAGTNLVVSMSGDNTDKLLKELTKSPLLKHLHPVIQRLPRTLRRHYLRLFRFEDTTSGTVQIACLLNGVPSKEFDHALLKWEWPAITGVYIFQQFFIITREDALTHE
jgi:hypothetical protein